MTIGGINLPPHIKKYFLIQRTVGEVFIFAERPKMRFFELKNLKIRQILKEGERMEEKVYGFCNNKCKREVVPMDAYTAMIENLDTTTKDLIGRVSNLESAVDALKKAISNS